MMKTVVSLVKGEASRSRDVWGRRRLRGSLLREGVAGYVYFLLERHDEERQIIEDRFPSLLPLLEREYHALLARSLTAARQLCEISGEMAKENVEFVLLRGLDVAFRVYPRPVRPLSDVDLLVAPSVREGAERALSRLGYTTTVSLRDAGMLKAALYVRDVSDVPVHLHVHPVNATVPLPYAGSVDAADFFGAAGGVDVCGVEFRVPSAECLLVHLAEHAFRHGFSPLYRMLDMYLLVRRLRIDWEKAYRMAEKWRVLPVAGASLMRLKEIFQMEDVPGDFLTAAGHFTGIPRLDIVMLHRGILQRGRILWGMVCPPPEVVGLGVGVPAGKVRFHHYLLRMLKWMV